MELTPCCFIFLLVFPILHFLKLVILAFVENVQENAFNFQSPPQTQSFGHFQDKKLFFNTNNYLPVPTKSPQNSYYIYEINFYISNIHRIRIYVLFNFNLL